MEEYGKGLVRMADSLVFALEGSLGQCVPAPAMGALLGLASAKPIFNLPSVLLETRSSALDEQEHSFWIQRLNNTIRIQAAGLQRPAGASVDGLEDGVLVVRVLKGCASLRITLVPVFESYAYAWHILSLSLQDTPEALQTALLIRLQSRFNRIPTTECRDLLDGIQKELGRFHGLLSFHRLLGELEALRAGPFPGLELQYKGRLEVALMPWVHEGPEVTIAYHEGRVMLKDEDGGEIEVPRDSQGFAINLTNSLLDRHTRLRLEFLYEEIHRLAMDSWVFFSSDQLLLNETFLAIQLPISQVRITLNRANGQVLLHGPSLDEFKDVQTLARSIRDLRLSQLGALLANRLASNPSLRLADSAVLGLAQLGQNHVVFSLTQHYGKVIVMDFDGHCIHYGWEDRSSGRYNMQRLSEISALFDADAMANQLAQVAEQILPTVIRQECMDSGLMVRPVDAATLDVRNIGTPPSVTSVELRLLTPHSAAFTVKGALVNPTMVQSSISPETASIESTERFHFPRLLTRLRAFLALLILSKQLELRMIRHELEVDHLAFVHTQLGRVIISCKKGTGYYQDALPLTISFQHANALTAEQRAAMQRHIERSVNIQLLLEFTAKAVEQGE